MCEKCVEIDQRIARLNQIAAIILDQQTIDAINAMIPELEAQKAALHPEQGKMIGAKS
jgi:hypothetical protein